MSTNSRQRETRTVTPYLVVPGAADLITFLEKSFGARETERHTREDGTIMHAEVAIGDSFVMIGEANEQYGPMQAMVHLYLPDVDAAYARALEAGAESIQAPVDQPYGDRSAGVKEASGTTWWIATQLS